MKLVYEKSVPGRKGLVFEGARPDELERIPRALRRAADCALPELGELDVVRHFTQLSRRNFGIDTHFYPLGSCTMKYNPRFTEEIAALPGFRHLHPLLPQLRGGGEMTQGALQVLYETERLLAEITGMDHFTLQPMAGAHGELTGIMMIAAHHRARGAAKKRVIVPDSAHGTNPASAAIAGFSVTVVPSDANGVMDLEKFRQAVGDDLAAVMLTCPNTLGIFNPHVKEIADIAHAAGALVYYDGANLNAILGRARPGDLGFDVVHLNLHKTFATPHGGGGPGAGPVGYKNILEPYSPTSRVVRRDDGTYCLEYDVPASIGYVAPFYGNFAVILKAYAYMLRLGEKGLRSVGDHAVLNANYIMAKIRGHLEIACAGHCMHEFVASAEKLKKETGVSALDIAKALIDRGYHPPTVYFPLIVKEALMIEPTETESLETLDEFVDTLIGVVELARSDPDELHRAPRTMPVSRLDEVKAVKDMNFGV